MNTTGITHLGAHIIDGKTRLTVWAPQAESVSCKLLANDETLELLANEYGYWQVDTIHLHVGESYVFVIDGKEYPDPASKSQADGVHGASTVVDLHYPWTDQGYKAPEMRELIIYELHIGTFSEPHNFAGAIERLAHLKELGINAIEIMPVAQFPGERNWGYDGVFSFAVQHSYGGAQGLQDFVNACHKLGIAVILDVVYNHFGPEGNYLPNFAPYFTDKYGTPWGKAINFDDAGSYGVRDFVLDNVRMWFEDFHIDGLRMDAVHAIKDFSPMHMLQEIRTLTNEIIAKRQQPHYLIVECDLNDKRFLKPLAVNGFGMDAQWLDEFHHALRVAVGEEKKGYYKEFDGLAHLAKAYEKAYVFDGNYSTHRQKFFGTSADGLPGEQFIVFSQNHDQVGNRMLGERSASLFDASTQRLLAFAVLISPFTPMLFMGEEWGSKRPFQYFVSHSDKDLIEAVRKGRTQEFAEFHAEGTPPDPQADSTFLASTLDWRELENPENKILFNYYKAVLALRKKLLAQGFIDREKLTVEHDQDNALLLLTLNNGEKELTCILNFSSNEQQHKLIISKASTFIFHTDDEQWGGSSTTTLSENQDTINIPARSGIVCTKLNQ